MPRQLEAWIDELVEILEEGNAPHFSIFRHPLFSFPTPIFNKKKEQRDEDRGLFDGHWFTSF
jgi:hypothetical protein